MVHGQAIGIPFRRRKGEQAPPPPKEVAWNPTIESNLPYKEVKYFKFVEGAGWQALNIGEILPVGQRVMIRIVTTEPYYEVSKAVSSQMTGIQIGKNGVSEYDIAGVLTVYSPQILTVTIGIDKNYVQWNPVVESNVPYKSIRYYKLGDSGSGWMKINIGDYITIGRTIMITIDTVNTVDELVSAVSSQLTGIGINGSNGTYNITGTLTSESPQNINITIDEYIRYEDIDFSTAYPFVPLLQGISWGDKLKVGNEVTFIGFKNILPNFYTRTGEMKLNGNDIVANFSVIVEKSMKFEVSRNYTLDNNEPKVILSPNRLRIPNSSYKLLGYIPDISGHGNHGVIHNSAYAEMSGVNGYPVVFGANKTWTNESNGYVTSITSNTIHITNVLNAGLALLYSYVKYNGNLQNIKEIPPFKIEIKGLEGRSKFIYKYLATSDATKETNLYLGNGTHELPKSFLPTEALINDAVVGFSISPIEEGVTNFLSDITIKVLPEYEGAYCLDGVDDFITIPTLSSGGKQVLMKVNWNKAGMMYDQRTGLNSSFAIYSLDIANYVAYNRFVRNGNTYIDGVLNQNILCGELKGITHNIICTNGEFPSQSPIIGSNFEHKQDFSKMALYDFMLFDEISTDDKIKELNEYMGIAGGYVEKPEYYWDCFGKTNDDPDRDAITEQVSKDVANALSVKNADFKLDSGFGKYEVDFLDTSIWNSSNSTITSSKIDCKNAISHIMLLYYNVGDKEYPDIPSFKIIKTGADIDYSYIDETGFPRSVRIVDGVNVLPASHNTLYSGSGRFCGFGNPGIGNSVTITQIPEYQNGFVFNGKTAYLENLNILAITDFTAIAKRVWANKDNPMNECFIHKGVVSTPISESAFMLEYEITNDTYYRSASFGGYINVERVNRPENITYQTTESYNGIPIIKGSGIDTKGLVIGAVTNNYWKGIFYKLMLYSKTIDMLSINALKNLFALDILIDINHPIFKK